MEYRIIRTEDYLSHHGTKGQKWGERRYQYKDGSLTPLGRIRYNRNPDFKKSVDRKRALDKARATKEAKKLEAEKREKLLNSSDREELYKNKHLLTTAELNERLNRIDVESRLASKVPEPTPDPTPMVKTKQDERKEKLLTSADPEELYKNRALLTTAEINERINRIDAEARLASKIPAQKSGADLVNEKLKTISTTVNNATDVFNKVDNAYSSVMKSAIGKTLAKKLGLEPPKKAFDYDDFIKNINFKSPEEIATVSKRISNETIIRDKYGNMKKSTTTATNSTSTESKADDTYERAKKMVDDYINSGMKDDRVTSEETSRYSYNKSDIKDSKVGTGNSNVNSRLRIEQIDKYKPTGWDVEGKGTSRYDGSKTYWYDDNPIWRDASTSSPTYSENARIGQNYMQTFLLEEKDR